MLCRVCSAVLAATILVVVLGGPVGAQEDPEIELTASAYPVAPGAPVNLRARISGAIQGDLEYRFSFGDGSSSPEWSTSSSVTHTYAQIGHYDANVQVRDGTGLLGIERIRISVLVPPSRPFPQKNSPVIEDGEGRGWWIVNPDNDSVSRIGPTGKIFEVPLGAGCHPQSAGRSEQGDIWVTCFKTDEVKIISERGKVIKTIKLPYGSAPFAIVTDPRKPRAYLSLYGRGALQVINTRQQTLLGQLKLGPTPRALALTADGSRILVTRFISSDEGGQVWDVNVTNSTPVLEQIIELPADLATPDTQSSGRGIPNYVSSIAIDPSGSYALVAANKANIIRGLFKDGNDLNTVNTIRVMVAKINLATGAEIVSARRDIDNSESPSAIAFSPFGDYAFITLQGNNVIAVYDMFTPESAGVNFHATLTRIETGLAPQGITFSRNGETVAVQNFMGRSLSLFSATEFLRGTSSAFERKDYRSILSETLQPVVLRGKQIFYNASDNGGREGRNRMSAEGYFSCATCHLDGSLDGRTWDFSGRGEGLRNTTDLRGRAGLGHGRIHWSANFDEIHDFENDMRNAFGGDGFLSESDFVQTADTLGVPKAGRSSELDALSAYVSSLDSSKYPRSPYRTAEGEFTEDARIGAGIFAQQGCQTCHTGPQFTDSVTESSVLHNIGTLSTASGNRLGQALVGIDTPTLLGLWDTAPYLHDGSATTLEQVFQPGKGAIYQAEDGVLSGGAVLSTDQSLNGEAHGVLSVSLPESPAAVSFSQVPGGSGGGGRIGVRYHTGFTGGGVILQVNGVPYELPLLETHHSGSHDEGTWSQAFVDVELAAGDTNVVDVVRSASGTPFTLDEISVAPPQVVDAAFPHSRIAQLSLPDQARLRSYLLQLDGRSEDGVSGLLFYRGYNLGGDSVVIAGDRWLGKRAGNYLFRGQETVHSISSSQLSEQENILGQTSVATREITFTGLPDGIYSIMLYIGSAAGAPSASVSLNGEQSVDVPILQADVPIENVSKYGPYAVTSRNSRVSIRSPSGEIALAGVGFFLPAPTTERNTITLRGNVKKRMVNLQIEVDGERRDLYRYTIWSGDRVLRRFRSKQRSITLNIRRMRRRGAANGPSFIRVRAQNSQGEISEQVFQYR